MFVRTAVSYVTGGHILKAGFTFGNGNEVHMLGNQLAGAIPYSYRFNNGVPNQITLYAYAVRARIDHTDPIRASTRRTSGRSAG